MDPSKRSSFFPCRSFEGRGRYRMKLVSCQKAASEFRKGGILSILRIAVDRSRDIFVLDGSPKS